MKQFCEILAQAYDAAGGQGDVPIEAVFRQAILLLQPATFWATIDASKFQCLSRATFRSRLSAILADNVKSSDGREMRLTPTVTRKDVWELLSPAEGRVVQVGRLAFVKKVRQQCTRYLAQRPCQFSRRCGPGPRRSICKGTRCRSAAVVSYCPTAFWMNSRTASTLMSVSSASLWWRQNSLSEMPTVRGQVA